MRTISAKQLLGAAIVGLLCALAPAAVQGQAVSGRVIDATGKAVPGAQVAVAGTGVRATTDAEGRYSLTVTAPGAIALRVTAVGFSPQSKGLTVAAGQTASVDFTLNANPVGLDAILVNGYGQGQKAKESRRKSSNTSVKEMKYRPKIGQGDFDTKTRKVEEFLTEGHKVKVTIMFRGREMQHPELGRHILDRVIETVSHVALVEAYPKQDGRNMVMVLGPDKKAQVKRVPRTRSDNSGTSGSSRFAGSSGPPAIR